MRPTLGCWLPSGTPPVMAFAGRIPIMVTIAVTAIAVSERRSAFIFVERRRAARCHAVDMDRGYGVALCRRFYEAVVAPRLAGVRHGAALLGEGSEVLGYDDPVSRDHDFDARVQIFLPERADPAPVLERLAS